MPAAQACSVRPERLTIDRIREASDVVVRGQLTYAFSEEKDLPFGDPNWLVGEISARKVGKGAAAKSYSVRHVAMQFYCNGAGWEPDPEYSQPAYTGDFYLRRNADNSYIILGYRP